MTQSLRGISVLVPGRLHPHARERIEREFELVAIASGDAALVTSEIATRVRGLTAMTRVDAALIDSLPNLEIIANFGVGYDAVDAPHAATRDVMVTNTPDVLTDEVADTALALLLSTVRELPAAERWLRAGRWEKEGPYPLTPTTLRGRTLGIFGMGRIGLAVAKRAEAFGLPIHYHNRRPVEGLGYTYHDTLAGLARAVDTLVSVAPGTAETEKAVNAAILEALGPEGIFVNIGRGSTVDEDALIAALQAGTIRGAGLDVFAREPHVPQALVDLPNAVLLPHVGSASEWTRRAMADLVVDNLASWFRDGRAVTPVPETKGVEPRSRG